jgi:hypothetical protein
MLPFNKSALAALACKVPGNDGADVKAYEVQSGDVAVHSGRIIARITEFSPLSDGLREFGTDSPLAGYAIHPWFLKRETQALPHRVFLPLPVVTNLYKPLKAWLSCRKKPKTKDEKEQAKEDPTSFVPLVQMSFTRVGKSTLHIQIEGEGDGPLPGIEFSVSVEIEDLARYADREFAYNAVELCDALGLFAKLKSEEGKLQLAFSQDPDDPIWLSAHAEGHDILVGLPFVRERSKADAELNASADRGAILEEAVEKLVGMGVTKLTVTSGKG